MSTEKNREDRARRLLAKHGYRLEKTPSRAWERQYYGPGYMIISCYDNIVRWGYGPRQWMLSLDEVEQIISERILREVAA